MPRSIALMILALPAIASAQSALEGTATMSASRSVVRAGDTLELEVRAEVAELPDDLNLEIDLPDLSAFDLLGRRVEIGSEGPRQTTHVVTMRAREPGTFALGAATVRAAEKELLTNELTIVVEPAEPSSVQIVEESQASEQIVERGYVRGEGRGVQYGAHFISPIYLTDVRNAAGEDTYPEGGFGLWGRIGWEFPLGFTLEVLGGVAANGVDTLGTDADPAFMRADIGLGARYMIFNDTAFVPFVQIGGTLRFFFFDWQTSDPSTRQVDGELTGALHGAIGAQIELSPYFGIEAGLAVDYTFAADIFAEGIVSLMPFLGVTLYVYDETGN